VKFALATIDMEIKILTYSVRPELVEGSFFRWFDRLTTNGSSKHLISISLKTIDNKPKKFKKITDGFFYTLACKTKLEGDQY